MARRNWGVVVPPESVLLSVKQVAERLGCSTRSVYTRIYAGDFTRLKIGGSTRIESAEVERYIATRGDVDQGEGVPR
jgi:excisionase family DNA binding protein